MLKIKEAIVVEGRYDKNTLAQLVDGLILTTSGFGIFKDRAQLELLRRVAARQGVVVLTDSDGAGFVIRNYLKGVLPPEQVKHAYIPDIRGKERRKAAPGREGKLGVEGMRPQVLEAALRQAGVTFLEDTAQAAQNRSPIAKGDLFALGLSGGAGASLRRKRLLEHLQLPEHMSANALLEMLNALFSLEQLRETVKKIF